MGSKILDCDPKTFVYLPLSAKMNETLYLHPQSEKWARKNLIADWPAIFCVGVRAHNFGTEPRGRHNEGKFAFAWASITFQGTDWGKWANTFGWEPSLDGPITKK